MHSAGLEKPTEQRFDGRRFQALVIGCGNPLCTRDITLGLVRGLQEIGAAVDFFDTLVKGVGGESSLLRQAASARAAVAVHGRRIAPALVERIRAAGTPTVLWATDDPHEIDDSARYGRHYDFVLTVERHAVEVHGTERSAWLPTAVDPAVYRPRSELFALCSRTEASPADRACRERRRQEILVAGSLYPERLRFLSEIGDWLLTKAVRIIGPKRGQWYHRGLAELHEARCLTAEEMACYVAGSRLVLDIPRDPFRSAFGQTNRRGVRASGCGPRCFQVPAAGAVLATSSDRADVFEHFDRSEVLIYDGPQDFAAQAERLLGDRSRWCAMVEKSRRTVLTRHTYAERARALVDILEKRVFPAARRGTTAFVTPGRATAACESSAVF